LDEKELLGEEAVHYKKSRDILDVWFDSGATNICVLKENPSLAFPADLYLEGSDQHRGWFNSSLLVSLAVNGAEPYKTVLTHGYVIDIEGQKMSKSFKNMVRIFYVCGQLPVIIEMISMCPKKFCSVTRRLIDGCVTQHGFYYLT